MEHYQHQFAHGYNQVSNNQRATTRHDLYVRPSDHEPDVVSRGGPPIGLLVTRGMIPPPNSWIRFDPVAEELARVQEQRRQLEQVERQLEREQRLRQATAASVSDSYHHIDRMNVPLARDDYHNHYKPQTVGTLITDSGPFRGRPAMSQMTRYSPTTLALHRSSPEYGTNSTEKQYSDSKNSDNSYTSSAEPLRMEDMIQCHDDLGPKGRKRRTKRTMNKDEKGDLRTLREKGGACPKHRRKKKKCNCHLSEARKAAIAIEAGLNYGSHGEQDDIGSYTQKPSRSTRSMGEPVAVPSRENEVHPQMLITPEKSPCEQDTGRSSCSFPSRISLPQPIRNNTEEVLEDLQGNFHSTPQRWGVVSPLAITASLQAHLDMLSMQDVFLSPFSLDGMSPIAHSGSPCFSNDTYAAADNVITQPWGCNNINRDLPYTGTSFEDHIQSQYVYR